MIAGAPNNDPLTPHGCETRSTGRQRDALSSAIADAVRRGASEDELRALSASLPAFVAQPADDESEVARG